MSFATSDIWAPQARKGTCDKMNMGRADASRKTGSSPKNDRESRNRPQNLPLLPPNRYILTRQTSLDPTPMNMPGEMNFEEMLRVRLEVLRREHRDLDEAIAALQESARADALTLRRLKKQKLSLKDQIVKLEDQLIPDIIA